MIGQKRCMKFLHILCIAAVDVTELLAQSRMSVSSCVYSRPPVVFPPTHRASEEAFLADTEDNSPGSEWERVARLCDFNPKTNKQAKDVSRMRSVLISLKQTPLVR